MAKSSKTYIKGFFENLRGRIDDMAEENLKQMIPYLTFLMHSYAEQALKEAKKRSMTGNFINSFGIALYRDGKFVAVGTTNDEEGQAPIHVTLASGDTFYAGEERYEGRRQYNNFTATEGTHRFFANEEVINWLSRYPPSRKDGFSFRAVTVVDYAESLGGDKVLLRLAEDIEGSGGVISEYNLG